MDKEDISRYGYYCEQTVVNPNMETNQKKLANLDRVLQICPIVVLLVLGFGVLFVVGSIGLKEAFVWVGITVVAVLPVLAIYFLARSQKNLLTIEWKYVILDSRFRVIKKIRSSRVVFDGKLDDIVVLTKKVDKSYAKLKAQCSAELKATSSIDNEQCSLVVGIKDTKRILIQAELNQSMLITLRREMIDNQP